jgi:hypothetical protein
MKGYKILPLVAALLFTFWSCRKDINADKTVHIITRHWITDSIAGNYYCIVSGSCTECCPSTYRDTIVISLQALDSLSLTWGSNTLKYDSANSGNGIYSYGLLHCCYGYYKISFNTNNPDSISYSNPYSLSPMDNCNESGIGVRMH